MTIGIIGSRGYPYIYSGYETFISELAPRLVQRGHTVIVYCHRGLFQVRPPTVKGVKLIYIPALEKKVFSQFTHSFLATIHACISSTDILLYVNSANGPFGLFTKIARKRTAINVDGLEWLRPKWKGLGRRYFWLASYLSTKLFDAIISDSERMSEIYQKEFGSSSITIAYGANIGHSTNSQALNQWALTPGEYYLIVGRLVPDNNANVIIEGFMRSPSRKKLVILGDVPYRDKYAQSIRRTDDVRVVFLGYIRDPNALREFYCNAFVYIHGHEYGGTNPSLLNALGNGCCILALDTSFNREVLSDERFGLYFQKSPESVCRMIEKLESDGEAVNRLKNNSRSRILERYTWEHITDQYEDLFNDMISGH